MSNLLMSYHSTTSVTHIDDCTCIGKSRGAVMGNENTSRFAQHGFHPIITSLHQNHVIVTSDHTIATTYSLKPDYVRIAR